MSIASFLTNHAVADIQPSSEQSFAPIPKGLYELDIERIEWRESSTGGVILVLGLTTQTASGAKRWVWHNINVVNHSPRAQEIGQQQYAQLLFALDTDSQTMIDNAGQFAGRKVNGYVSIDKRNENVIRSFEPNEPLPTHGAAVEFPPLDAYYEQEAAL